MPANRPYSDLLVQHNTTVSTANPEPPIVVKIGGSTLGGNDTSLQDLVSLHRNGKPIVIVHGGGNVISEWMQRQNLAPNFVNGLRVTDAPSLEIVVAVLGGLVNKELTALMQQLAGRPSASAAWTVACCRRGSPTPILATWEKS